MPIGRNVSGFLRETSEFGNSFGLHFLHDPAAVSFNRLTNGAELGAKLTDMDASILGEQRI